MQTLTHSTVFQYETQLIEAARRGAPAELIEYLYLEKLPVRAARLVSGYRAAYGAHLDVEDVVMVGVEAIMLALTKALAEARDPVGWLLTAALRRMLKYCREYRSPVRVPDTAQWRGVKVPSVWSLDAPLAGHEDLTLADLVAAEDCYV